MTDLNILHLSDIHFRKKQKERTFFRDVQQKLVQAIAGHIEPDDKKKNDDDEDAKPKPPEVVVITGDIAFSGKTNEYNLALELFEKIDEIVPGNIEFLPVPGNHDVDRSKIRTHPCLHNIVKSGETNKFLEDKRNIRDFIDVKFKAYKTFFKKLNPNLYDQYKKNLFWVKDIPEKKISILGLNSAWACKGDKENFHIALGYPQLMDALEKSKISNKVFLMHHPPANWLYDTVFDKKTKAELFRNCSLLLHGHIHGDDALVNSNPDQSFINLSANASYTDEKDGFIGFQFVNVKFNEKGEMPTVTVWPYIFSELRNEFVPHRERWRNQGGRPYFVIGPPARPKQTKAVAEPLPDLQIPDDYVKWVEEFHSTLPTEQLTQKGKPFILGLTRLYTPLGTRNPFYDAKNKESKEPEVIDIEQLVNRFKELPGQVNCFLIIGNAGTGKTTFLKYLAYKLTHGMGPLNLKVFLPVLIFLDKFWPIFKQEIQKNNGAVDLDSVLPKYLDKLYCPLTRETIISYLNQHKALFLMDGLDEVPPELRSPLLESFHQYKFAHKQNLFFLTGRPHGVNEALEKCYPLDIAGWDKDKVGLFITKWIQTVSLQESTFELNPTAMTSDILSHEYAGMFTGNPLLLTALCIFYVESAGQIPYQRAELFKRIFSNLLYRRFHNLPEPEAVNKIGEYIALLAFNLHSRKTKSIDVFEAMELLKEVFPPNNGQSLPEYKNDIKNRFENIESAGGLLNRLSNNEIEFVHLSFQEFLAAKHMLDMEIDYNQYLHNPWWEEVFLLFTGLMNIDMKIPSNRVVEELIKKGADSRIQLIGARALSHFKPSRRDENVTKDTNNMLLKLINSGAPLKDRFEAGEILGVLGDPRIKSLPMMVVEKGEFIMGGGKNEWLKMDPAQKIYLDQFEIGKYPVTNEEYAMFMREDGYKRREFWTPEGWSWRTKEDIREPRLWLDGKWNGPNFPAVGVSWYEAVAYTKWLSHKTGNEYTLPTEAQWEKAARGNQGLAFPWGDTFSKNMCNTSSNRLERTNPVGIFPGAESPYGCVDMSGNVWEWCLDWYDKEFYKYRPVQNPQGPANPVKDELRVMRGGSWFAEKWRCGGAFRDYEGPDERFAFLGFRIVRHAQN